MTKIGLFFGSTSDNTKIATEFIKEYLEAHDFEVEDFDIGEYLDNKIMQNAKITGQIRSTLNKFETQFGRPKKKSLVISENNSSEEEKLNDD